MAHLILAIILGILAYFISAAVWSTRQVVHVLIGVLVGLLVYFGTGLLV